MRRWRSASGQATSEYIALVALVAVALALAAGLTAGGVGGQVLAGLQRGLCRVTDVRCPAPARPRDQLAPCPVERTTSAESLDGAFELLELGDGATLSATRMSDGRVTVALADDRTLGGQVGVGYAIALGRRHGAGAAIGIASRVARGRSWTLPSAAAARAFVARYGAKATLVGKAVDTVRSGCSVLCDALGWQPHAALPPPDATTFDRAGSAAVGGSLALAGLEASKGRVLGAQLRRDGGSTLYVRLDADAGAYLLSSTGLAVGGEHETVLAYTLDPQGQPVGLAIEAVAAGATSAQLGAGGGVAASAAGGVGRVTEVEATLDLRDPARRDTAVGLARALAHPLEEALQLRRRAVEVARLLAAAGVVTRRTYAVSSSAFAVGAAVQLGGRLGGTFERTRERMRLLSAQTRLPGLPFLPRDDCRRSSQSPA